jgi:pimeloyl-ACP methyl ester carboxylesterase
MAAAQELKVNSLDRGGVRLAHVEAGPRAPANPPLVFIHGWIGDHTALLPQIEHFAKTRRVVAIHLRGHGDSDAPRQDYTMAGFADDVAWQCEQLGLDKPVVVGHSLGGAVALELGGRHPDLASGIVIIDSVLFPRPIPADVAKEMLGQLTGPDYRAAARAQAVELYLDHVDIDDPDRKEALLNLIYKAHEKTPPHAAISTMANLFNGYDSTPAAKACKAPVAYLDAGVPVIEQLRDLDRFKAACPQLIVAKILGAGHFAPLEVPDQVNAMIARFVAVGIDRRVYAEASAR